MSTPRRQFRRPLGERRYRKLYVIAAEGAKTEPQYFAILNNEDNTIKVECLRAKNESSPLQVLDRMERRLSKESLRSSDEAWLVVDKDNWTDAQLSQLHMWSLGRPNRGFAVSNPRFEYWLLLHFEEGDGIATSRECSERLRRYLPDYDKGIDPRKTSRIMILDAVQRARRRDNPNCPDWPRMIGTTVYRLVESIMRA